jgi:hypothetical protein
MNYSILIFLAQAFPKVEKDGTGITPAKPECKPAG